MINPTINFNSAYNGRAFSAPDAASTSCCVNHDKMRFKEPVARAANIEMEKAKIFPRVYEEKSVNKNFYDNSWLVSI